MRPAWAYLSPVTIVFPSSNSFVLWSKSFLAGEICELFFFARGICEPTLHHFKQVVISTEMKRFEFQFRIKHSGVELCLKGIFNSGRKCKVITCKYSKSWIYVFFHEQDCVAFVSQRYHLKVQIESMLFSFRRNWLIWQNSKEILSAVSGSQKFFIL